MLPTNAASILTCALRLPPASTTAMSMGWPICLAFRWAASMTRRASSSVWSPSSSGLPSLISLSRCFPSMQALEPWCRDLAQHKLARSQPHSLYPLDLLWYPADVSPIPAWTHQHNYDALPLLTLVDLLRFGRHVSVTQHPVLLV